MTKNVTNRPGAQPITPRTPSTRSQGTAPTSSTKKPTASDKIKDKKVAHRSERQPVQRAHRPHRPHGGGHAAAAHGGDEHGEEAGGAGAVGAADSADDLHRHRSGEIEAPWEPEEVDVEPVEEVLESGATGADSIKRSKGSGGQGSSDGFDDGQQQREAYERLMKGNVKSDALRFDELRKKGIKDGFVADSAPPEVERQGVPRVAAHVVRLFDKWTLEGLPRDDAIGKMALWLSQLSTPQAIRKVLTELESKPIRDVYPLELFMHLLEHRPELLPNVKKGAVLGNIDDLNSSQKIFAGHSIQLHIPPDTRLKSLALLGGVRPGYEFFPTANSEDRYTLLIDTPGRWTFAVLAVPLVSIGRIQKEGTDAILELFQVTVNAMGKKGEPISPELWAEQQAAMLEAQDDDEEDDEDDVAVALPKTEPAPILILQIRKALEQITRDPTSTATAATYSWELRLYVPGGIIDGEGLLHLVVEKAGPFDPVWHRAREAITQKQREHEPGRALLTQEDLANAIRRARVRD